jgi:DNA-binding GntR family transcriptional regulator
MTRTPTSGNGLELTPATGSECLGSMAHQKIMTDIIGGRLKPGRKLRVKSLMDSYGVGNSPAREALNQLVGEGLVVRQDHTGFRVAPTSAEELREIVTTRCWLEEMALRRSIRHGDERWEERIILAHHRLSRTPGPAGVSLLADRLEWEHRHREFHLALISGCGSGILVDYCLELQRRSFRYRNLSSVRAYRDNLDVAEHREIHDAVLDRDADRAVELLTDHYRATVEIFASEENP